MWKKGIGIFAAMNCVGCGVALFLKSGLGSDPIGILCDGISRTLGIQFGNASLLYNLIIIAFALLVARQNLGGGTVVYAIFSGYFIDFYCRVFTGFYLENLDLLIKIMLCLVGEVLFALGLAILIRFRLGMNALDALLYKIERETKISYAALRRTVDILYTIAGFFMGGVFGMGTVLCVLLTGTLVSKFTKAGLKFAEA